jgi:hypothetical protein
MFTNINNTSNGIETIVGWFNLNCAELPPDFPTQKILEGLNIITRNNIFFFDNQYFKQEYVTAMGTSCV